MPQTLTALKNADIEFFQGVRRDPTLAATLARLSFDEPYIGGSQHNAVFVISKSSWTLPKPAGHERTLNIHFEAKDRREMRLEIGIDPPVSNLDRKPEMKAALAPVLARKTRIIHVLRTRLLGSADIPARFETNARRLLEPGEAASHGVVKFSGCGYGADPQIEQAAQWFAEVIATVTPIVDEIAGRYQAA